MKPKRPITFHEAQARLEALCSRAEHSTGELTDRMHRWGISASDAEKIIVSLTRNRFVDDRRFAKAYVTDKIKFARWGKRKIYQGLRMKKIDSSIISETLAEIDDSLYISILESLLRAKIALCPELLESYEGRTRLFRFAASRGFEPQICSKILRIVMDDLKK